MMLPSFALTDFWPFHSWWRMLPCCHAATCIRLVQADAPAARPHHDTSHGAEEEEEGGQHWPPHCTGPRMYDMWPEGPKQTEPQYGEEDWFTPHIESWEWVLGRWVAATWALAWDMWCMRVTVCGAQDIIPEDLWSTPHIESWEWVLGRWVANRLRMHGVLA